MKYNTKIWDLTRGTCIKSLIDSISFGLLRLNKYLFISATANIDIRLWNWRIEKENCIKRVCKTETITDVNLIKLNPLQFVTGSIDSIVKVVTI